jgi:ABC-type Na+ efflux pump permease subunit
MRPEIKVLFRKEWRQLVKSRGPFITSMILPVLLVLVGPIAAVTSVGAKTVSAGELAKLPAGLQHQNPALALLPFLLMVAGIMIPMVTATHSIISERESRTLELLVAMPIRIGDILTAKFLAVLAASWIPPMLFLAIDTIVFVSRGDAEIGFMLALFFQFTCTLAYGAASALLVGLLARDFRTANNIGGALIIPVILLGSPLVALLPPSVAPFVIGFVFAAAAAGIFYAARRWVTFERLLR